MLIMDQKLTNEEEDLVRKSLLLAADAAGDAPVIFPVKDLAITLSDAQANFTREIINQFLTDGYIQPGYEVYISQALEYALFELSATAEYLSDDVTENLDFIRANYKINWYPVAALTLMKFIRLLRHTL